jgi:hypothetical protein
MLAFQQLQAPATIKYELNPYRVKVYGFFPEIKSQHPEMLVKNDSTFLYSCPHTLIANHDRVAKLKNPSLPKIAYF